VQGVIGFLDGAGGACVASALGAAECGIEVARDEECGSVMLRQINELREFRVDCVIGACAVTGCCHVRVGGVEGSGG
jgi:hypothetical protein